MTFELGIWHGAEQLTSGEVVYVHADAGSRKSLRLPDWLRERVRGFERLAPPTEVG
ncbi:hypothetical protein D3C85_1944580 [compost metagenome]